MKVLHFSNNERTKYRWNVNDGTLNNGDSGQAVGVKPLDFYTSYLVIF